MDDLSFLGMFIRVFFWIVVVFGWFRSFMWVLDIDSDYTWQAKLFKFLGICFLITIPIATLFYIAYSIQNNTQQW